MSKTKKVKLIAFYLPQFHQIPENDEWWGEGFTEWTNTEKALPLFEGHYQPKRPLDGRFYNLLDDSTKEWQVGLAKKYGIYGFCYYHYWFNGKLLLEKPAEQMLANSRIDLPFCFSWANENWCKTWDGGNKEVIMKQDYGTKYDWEKHYNYLRPFFLDQRYIKQNNKIIFLIYRTDLVPQLAEMLECWNSMARADGFDGFYFISQHHTAMLEKDEIAKCIDYQIRFEPLFSRVVYRKNHFMYRMVVNLKRWFTSRKFDNCDYDIIWNQILSYKDNRKIIPGAFVSWDNTPRKKNGIVFANSSPEKYGKYMRNLIKKIKCGEYDTDFLFINAWNEWGEGTYLEPDEKYGYAYLEETKKALDSGIF